ncbi:MAG: SDR family NAD(P)-dependent oxidoreductase [Oscillospiraceae bacterium]|jgi:short-subunit dehydrogenase|nr:SDR family NAD(P)-dependent oxidoreductase [Oscillospiraceae bacterium]
MKKIGIVTGASSGMGRDFALAFAKKYADGSDAADEIWLIARRADKLAELAARLPIPARVFAADLCAPGAIDEIAAALAEEKPDVRFLCNAAGYGKFALFGETERPDAAGIIDLNCRVLTELTSAVLPYMASGANIVNIGSLSSFQPVPYMAVYGASKAMVLSLSRALGVELAPRGIHVMCVCPGFVQTEFFDRAVSDNGAVTNYNKLWSPSEVVKKAMRDLSLKKPVSILGFGVRTQVRLVKLLPHSLVMKIWCRQQGHR